MKKRRNILKTSTMVGALCLIMATSGWSKDGKLTDITKPYLGTYECEMLYVGGEDKLDGFDYVRLELSSDGALKILYREKEKQAKSIPLSYEYDEINHSVTVYAKWGAIKKEKRLSLENGEINASFSLGRHTFVVKFKK